MLKGETRVCDVCGIDIPARTTYRQARLLPEVAAMLLENDDPDLIPSMAQEADGKVRLDICLECSLSMGKKVPVTEAN